MTFNSIGIKIKITRELVGLSLEELAARINRSSDLLSEVEKGTHQPTTILIRDIAIALGVNPSAWLEEIYPSTEELKNFHQRYHCISLLTEDEQQLVEDLIRIFMKKKGN
jgi:transcriptional regulator with XRE-family HTH domain